MNFDATLPLNDIMIILVIWSGESKFIKKEIRGKPDEISILDAAPAVQEEARAVWNMSMDALWHLHKYAVQTRSISVKREGLVQKVRFAKFDPILLFQSK